MNNSHLTDEILQDYLLRETKDNWIKKHLEKCSSCSERLEEYQNIIENVEKIKPETFPFDVTALIMEKINEVETPKEKNISLVLYLSLCVFLSIILFLLYPHLKTIFNQFKSFSVMSNVFILISAIGIAIFLLNDLFRQYKQKEILLSK